MKVAFVLARGYEDAEFRQPYDALRAAGHEVVVVGVTAGQMLEGKRGDDRIRTEVAAADVAAEAFDALVIAGGDSPGVLRDDPATVALVTDLVRRGRTTGAICHAALLLAAAGVLQGRLITSWPSLRAEFESAGATWIDRPLVEDDHLITSRRPADLDQFCAALLRHLAAAQSAR